MKKLIFLGACLVALASQPVKAQTGSTDVVVVKVHESIGGEIQLTVCRGVGKSETTTLKARDAAAGKGAEAVQQLIAKLTQEGYVLKTSYGGGWNYEILNTLVFMKSQ